MAKKDKNSDIEAEQIWNDIQCNLSAFLYVLTEQQATIGRLLEELVRVGALNNDALSRITETTPDAESLTVIYTDIYNKFAKYVALTRKHLGHGEPDEDLE